MKTIHSVFLTFLSILLVVSPVLGSDWVELVRDGNGDVYSYNKILIEHKTKNVIKLWEKVSFSDEGIRRVIQIRRQIGESTDGWDKLSHSLLSVEINCTENKSRLFSSVHYDTNGSVLETMSIKEPQWTNIFPNSMDYNLEKIFCKKSNMKKTPVLTSDWVEYGSIEYGNYSYNKKKIIHKTNNILQVWEKLIFTNEGGLKMIEWRRYNGMSTEGYNNLSHTLYLTEIDCQKGMYRDLSTSDYDIDGKVLYTKSEKSNWDYIVPDSIMDNLRMKVCKTINIKRKK